MPAWVALVLWLLLQGWLAYLQVAGQTNDSALGHLGGAAVGLAAGIAWKEQDTRREEKEGLSADADSPSGNSPGPGLF